jgi:hypothetical protein
MTWHIFLHGYLDILPLAKRLAFHIVQLANGTGWADLANINNCPNFSAILSPENVIEFF